MTKKQAKEACGYTDKPVLSVCMNCSAFTSEKKLPAWMVASNAKAGFPNFTVEAHGVEKNARCVTGSFPVKKMGSCDNWKARG